MQGLAQGWRLGALGAIAAGLLLAMPLPAQAQWMWRDMDGQVTASDRPPPKDILDKDILSRPAPPDTRRKPAQSASAASAALAPAASPLDREVEARKRSAEQEQAAKAKAEEARNAAQRSENCRRARQQQSTLDTGQRMARVNDKGEREVLDDKARADEMRRARDVIASDCR